MVSICLFFLYPVMDFMSWLIDFVVIHSDLRALIVRTQNYRVPGLKFTMPTELAVNCILIAL